MQSPFTVYILLQGNRAVARDVLVRVVQIGTAIGLGMMLLIFNCRFAIPRIFSQDPAVVTMAADTLIVIALYLVRLACPSLARPVPLQTRSLAQSCYPWCTRLPM